MTRAGGNKTWDPGDGEEMRLTRRLRQGGVTHVFVSEFESEADRAYYLDQDPAHQAFKKLLDGVVATVRVVDFTPGAF